MEGVGRIMDVTVISNRAALMAAVNSAAQRALET